MTLCRMKLTLGLVVLTVVASCAWAQCPKPKDLPEKTSKGHKLCARLYENTDKSASKACQGRHLDVADKAWEPWMGSWKYITSAIVVRHGCEIKVRPRFHK